MPKTKPHQVPPGARQLRLAPTVAEEVIKFLRTLPAHMLLTRLEVEHEQPYMSIKPIDAPLDPVVVSKVIITLERRLDAGAPTETCGNEVAEIAETMPRRRKEARTRRASK